MKFLNSFRCAFRGIGVSVRSERNLKIHLAATVLVVIFGLWLRISAAEWLVCIAFVALVISLELVNTAIEAVVDIISPEWSELAGKAKDAAAGAVLAAAICAAIAAAVIFLPKLLPLI